LEFAQTIDGLNVNLPEQAPGKNAFVLKIEGTMI